MRHKLMFFLIPAFVLIVGTLFATESRMAGLGFPYGYIKDNSEISVYPGAIHRYKTVVIGELPTPGTETNWTLGANMPYQNYVGGVYLNTATNLNVDNYLYDTLSHSLYRLGDLDISKKIQFYLGLQEKYGIGFGMAIDNNKDDIADDPDVKRKSSACYFDLSGGISTDLYDAGLKIKYAGGSAENDSPEYKKFKDEFYLLGLDLAGRYYFKQTNDLDLMYIINGYFNLSSKKTDIADMDDNPVERKIDGTDFMIEAGAGLNYKINDVNTIIFGFKPIRFVSDHKKGSVAGSDVSAELTYNYTYVPEYNLALESSILPWLTARVGARQNYVFYSVKDDEGEDEIEEDSSYDSEFVMNLGLGFNFGRFTIDTVLEKDFLHNGPDFIGGNGNGLASKISLTYSY